MSWSVSGVPGGNAALGTITTAGVYTAPVDLPSPATVQVTATSHADATKSGTGTVAITSDLALTLTPSSPSVELGAAQAFQASVASSGHPDAAVRWSLGGAGCSGSSCGTLTVVPTRSAGSPIADSAAYTAPGTAPSPNTVTVTVTPQADPSKKAQATIVIQPGVDVSVSPATATLAANHRVTMNAQVNGTSNTSVNWSVNGIPGGNAAFGQICSVGSSPCQTVTNTTAPQVDYVAPGAIPSPNPVSATAVSAPDSTKSGSAQITVINHVLVSVQPGSVTLTPLAVQGFAASVLGTTNQSVVWQVQGTACSTASICGSVDTFGIYTAPAAPPTPDANQTPPLS